MRKLFTILTVFLFANAAIFAQVFSEDFESGTLPAGWTADEFWQIGSNTDISSQYFNPPAHTIFMGVNDDAPGNGVNTSGRVTTGDIDLSTSTYPILTFQAYFIDGDYGGDEIASVLVSTDGGSTWSEAKSLGGAGEWAEQSVNLVPYAGMTIRLAFDYVDGDSWNYGYCIDDLVIDEATNVFGVALVGAENKCANGAVGGESEISGTFYNEGVTEITSLDLNWSDGTNTYTETINVNVGAFESAFFTHPTPIAINSGSTSVDFWISNPNGMADPDDADNGASFSVNGIVPVEGRAIYVEEATGTWCTWCPRGAVWMERMADWLRS